MANISVLEGLKMTAQAAKDYTDKEKVLLMNQITESAETFNTGKLIKNVPLAWEVGSIDNDGEIDTSNVGFWHTRLLSSDEINGAKIKSTNSYALYAYKYNEDGSFIAPYVSIGKVNDYTVPNEFVQNGKYVRLVIHANAYTSVTVKYGEKVEMQKSIDSLDSDMIATKETLYGKEFSIEYKRGEYVGNGGSFIPINQNWARTNFIPCNGIDALLYKNDGVATTYCAWYGGEDTQTYISMFSLQVGERQVAVPQGARYFVVSNLYAEIEKVTFTNLPTLKKSGLVDDVKDLYEKAYGEDIKIVMPDYIVGIVGEEVDIHYDNIVANCDASLISMKESGGGASYGMMDMVRLKYDTVANVNNSIVMSKEIKSNMTLSEVKATRKRITFKNIPLTSGNGLNRKVLLIGDSWTAPGIYARELRNLFADSSEPMNITLLGTLGDGGAEVGASTGYHEGHGGSSSREFCTKAFHNGYNNYFYNPSSQTFDFAYYMNYCGYSSVDDVFINLGINDVANIDSYDEIIGYYNQMITSIKAYNSNIRIFIGLCGLPAEYEYSTMHNNCQRSKARRLLFHERLMEEYGNRENEGFIIVPLHISIDTKHDFKTEMKPRSKRDSTLVPYCTDVVHPSAIAYNKVADTIRTYIKYAETL